MKRAVETLRDEEAPERMPAVNPATGEQIAWLPKSDRACARRAIAAAKRAKTVIGEGPTVGDEIVSHPDVNGVGFTGSAETGRRIAERGAGKALLLELGGNGPFLVFEDADLDRAARAAANGAFSNAGQICAATGRILAHRSIVEPLAERIAHHAKGYVLGDPLHQGVTMGPLNNPKVAAKVREHVDEAVAAGATVVAGGRPRPDLGSELFSNPRFSPASPPTCASIERRRSARWRRSCPSRMMTKPCVSRSTATMA